MPSSARGRTVLAFAALSSVVLAALGVVLVAARGEAAGIAVELALGLAAAAALLVLGAVGVAEWNARPLRRLLAAVQHPAPTPPPVRLPRLPLAGPSELRALAAAVNAQSATLGDALTDARAARDRLQEALSVAADIVIAVDHNGRIAFANRAADTALALPADQAVGRPLLDVLLDHEIHDLVTHALAGEASDAAQIRRDARRFQASARPVRGDALWAAVLVMHDVTALHEAEATRREFVADVSHELRSPLATITAAVETLESGVPAADASRFHAIIHTETDRMAQTVEEMLALARLESGLAQPQRRPLDPMQVIRSAVERIQPQAQRAGLQISVTAPDAPVSILADADLVERALTNILSNAIKFTPARGAISVFLRPDAERVGICVRDTGMGLTPEDAARVFDRFYRADRARTHRAAGSADGGGAGLGLAVVRQIADAHGGRVFVESVLDKGSTFGFTIPRAPAL